MRQLVARLEGLLPPGWTIVRRRARAAVRDVASADCVVVLRAPDGSATKLAIEPKQRVEPRDAAQLVDRLKSLAPAVPVVVSPYIGSRTRELLSQAGIGYLDGTGNVSIVVQRPALFIRTSGAERDPAPTPRSLPLRTLRGSRAGRAVRALCDFRPPYGVRELAARSNASAPTLSRVIDLLEREALLERGARGSVARLDVPGTIRRWVQDYGFARSNRVATYLDPRGLAHLRARLAESGLAYAVTGSLAAVSTAKVAPPRLAQVFVADAEAAASALGLSEAEAGANVVLAEPYDAVAFERTTTRGGLVCAAPPQVVADLLTSPGRAPAEAEALIAWMMKNEPRWRS